MNCSQVTEFSAGEFVFGASKFGAFAEFVCVDQNTMAAAKKSDLIVLADLLGRGRIEPVVDRTVALSEVPAAIRYLEEDHARGKVVVSIQAPIGTS